MPDFMPLLWLVLSFADGPDCLVQGSFQQRSDHAVFVREDGCPIRSQQEGRQVVLWSHKMWVLVEAPSEARSLSYRWGRAAAFVNGHSVRVSSGQVVTASQN